MNSNLSTRSQLRFAFAQRAIAEQTQNSTLALRESVASADASFRSYWRYHLDERTWIVMDAPTEHEDCRPFIDVSARLLAGGLRAPTVLAQDLSQGFLLLDDLGTKMLLPALNTGSVESLYGDALFELTRLTNINTDGLPIYDAQRLGAELDLFPQWFLQRHLGVSLTSEQNILWQRVRSTLIESALAQPQVFVHRDFHSRNLMLGAQHPHASDRFGILDFQDAVRGPLTYDLVSLLRDCYIEWPEDSVARWCESFRQRCGTSLSSEAFARAFDWMGLQRHLKVLGIFARLNYRDGKARYLQDLPLVLRYTINVAARYPQLQTFADWLRTLCANVDLSQPRP